MEGRDFSRFKCFRLISVTRDCRSLMIGVISLGAEIYSYVPERHNSLV